MHFCALTPRGTVEAKKRDRHVGSANGKLLNPVKLRSRSGTSKHEAGKSGVSFLTRYKERLGAGPTDRSSRSGDIEARLSLPPSCGTGRSSQVQSRQK